MENIIQELLAEVKVVFCENHAKVRSQKQEEQNKIGDMLSVVEMEVIATIKKYMK